MSLVTACSSEGVQVVPVSSGLTETELGRPLHARVSSAQQLCRVGEHEAGPFIPGP